MTPTRGYKTYNSHQLIRAVDMARRGVSVRRSANVCGVPESTVRKQLSTGKICVNIGKPTVLTQEEESGIVKWIVDTARAGFPVDSQRLKTTVAYFLKVSGRSNPFTNGIPGRKWLTLFLKRHPKISRRIPSALAKQRTNVTENQIREWFEEVNGFIKSANMGKALHTPESVFNMDESSMRLVPTKEQVFAETGDKYVHTSNANSEKECYTALFAANAAGTLAPPLVLFPYKQRLPAEIARSAPEGWAIGKNESGWMNQETFYYYLKNVFHPWLIKAGITFPVIVFVDGHKSHVSYQTMEFCRKRDITLICLYPNSTHLLQPLDVTFFRGLKVRWNKHLIEWRTFHAGKAILKHEFTPLLKKTVDEMPNMKNTLVNGFRKCGLVPWNPNAVNYAMLLKQLDSPKKVIETEMEQLENSKDVSEATIILAGIEAYLKLGQIKLFEQHQSAVLWPGPVGDTNLFYIWQQIRRDAAGIPSSLNRPVEIEDAFCGYDESEIEEERCGSRYNSTNTVSIDDFQIEQNITLDAKEQLEDEDKENDTDIYNGEDFFHKAFNLPVITPRKSLSNRKQRPRPPVVATSEEFKAFFIKQESEKLQEEQIRIEKRVAREARKQEKAKNGVQFVRKVRKNATKKPKMDIR